MLAVRGVRGDGLSSRFSRLAVLSCQVGLLACGNATHSPGDGGTGAQAGNSGSAGTAAGGQAGGPASGGTSGSGNAGSGGAIIDKRPPPPEWVPPFELGAPGWRESTVPDCVQQQGQIDALSVWADARGVFTLAAIGCNPLTGVGCGAEGVSLMFNSGSGWQSLYQIASNQPRSGSIQMTGFPGGSLLLAGGILGQVGIYSFDAGTLRNVWEVATSVRVFAGAKRAYAVDGTNVLESQGGAFKTIATLPSPGKAIWANEDIIAVVGDNQTFMTRAVNGGEFTPVAGVPAGDYSTLWGFSASDLWFGNFPGQLVHYDGTSFQVVSLATNPDDPTVRSLWGVDGELYFISTYEFGRVRAGSEQAEILIGSGSARVPRVHFAGLWGLSAKEVFLTLSDEDYYRYRCGGMFTLVFDGSRFHEF